MAGGSKEGVVVSIKKRGHEKRLEEYRRVIR